jgi:DNA polymerase III alpha subunit
MDKVPAVVCNKRVVESLIKAGAFDSFGTPAGLLRSTRRRRRRQRHASATRRSGSSTCSPAATPANRGRAGAMAVVDLPEWDKKVLLAYEREMLGLYVSDHPLMGLEQDAVLVVKGRVDRRDEGTQVIAMEVTEPDLSEARLGPVVLSVPASRCTPPLVSALREVLACHPGTTEVHLRLEGRGRTTLMRLDDGFRVSASAALMGDLKALLGPGCLVTSG